VRNLADTFIFSPPLTLKKQHVDVMMEAFESAITAVE
jgi:adenosylmethionine-8-amino-7-oxononanoate aminotransferase